MPEEGKQLYIPERGERVLLIAEYRSTSPIYPNQRFSGIVEIISAEHSVSLGKDDWYIEFRDGDGGYHYIKQIPDGIDRVEVIKL